MTLRFRQTCNETVFNGYLTIYVNERKHISWVGKCFFFFLLMNGDAGTPCGGGGE